MLGSETPQSRFAGSFLALAFLEVAFFSCALNTPNTFSVEVLC